MSSFGHHHLYIETHAISTSQRSASVPSPALKCCLAKQCDCETGTLRDHAALYRRRGTSVISTPLAVPWSLSRWCPLDSRFSQTHAMLGSVEWVILLLNPVFGDWGIRDSLVASFDNIASVECEGDKFDYPLDETQYPHAGRYLKEKCQRPCKRCKRCKRSVFRLYKPAPQRVQA